MAKDNILVAPVSVQFIKNKVASIISQFGSYGPCFQ